MPARPLRRRPATGVGPVGLALGLLALACCAPARADVALGGILGERALLVIDQAPPKTLRVGESAQGVRLIAVGRDSATVEQDGRRFELRLGEAPLRLNTATGNTARPASGRRITLTADSAGHFKSQGSINGQVMQFVVDTGATVVSIGRPDAERMGLAYLSGQPVPMQTANGVTQGWRIQLHSVRVGDVEVFDIEAVVTPTPMPLVLLGNSFLNRFQMHRVSDQMVLEKRL